MGALKKSSNSTSTYILHEITQSPPSPTRTETRSPAGLAVLAVSKRLTAPATRPVTNVPSGPLRKSSTIGRRWDRSLWKSFSKGSVKGEMPCRKRCLRPRGRKSDLSSPGSRTRHPSRLVAPGPKRHAGSEVSPPGFSPISTGY